MGSGGVNEIYAYMSALRGEEKCGGQPSVDTAGCIAVMNPDGIDEAVAVILIHHFVGVIVGRLSTGVPVTSSIYTVSSSPRALFVTKINKQKKSMMKMDRITNL